MATRNLRIIRALAEWLWQRYRLGWRTHPVLYLADAVCGVLLLGFVALAHAGALPWWPVVVVFTAGATVGTAAFFVRPWPPPVLRQVDRGTEERRTPAPPDTARVRGRLRTHHW